MLVWVKKRKVEESNLSAERPKGCRALFAATCGTFRVKVDLPRQPKVVIKQPRVGGVSLLS